MLSYRFPNILSPTVKRHESSFVICFTKLIRVVSLLCGDVFFSFLFYPCIVWYYRSLQFICIQYWSLLTWRNLRFWCGCVAVPVNLFFSLFHHVLRYLRTLYIIWSLVRRRVTQNGSVRFGAVAVIFSIYLKPVLYYMPWRKIKPWT